MHSAVNSLFVRIMYVYGFMYACTYGFIKDKHIILCSITGVYIFNACAVGLILVSTFNSLLVVKIARTIFLCLWIHCKQSSFPFLVRSLEDNGLLKLIARCRPFLGHLNLRGACFITQRSISAIGELSYIHTVYSHMYVRMYCM